MAYSIRKQHFINYVNHNVFSHAYIFEVGNYDSDYEFILNFIKLLFCEKNKFDELNCGKCNICRLIDENSFPDLYIIKPDGNEIKKDQLIKLEMEFSNTSIITKNKIYVILEAEKMNNYSSNSILKFIEEPQDNVYGILVTKNKYRLLPTIISRCMYFNIKDEDDYLFEDDFYINFITNLVNTDDLFINYDSLVEYFYDSNSEEEDNKNSKKSFNKKKILNFFNNLNIYLLKYYSGNVSDKSLDKINNDKILEYINNIQDSLLDLEYNVNYKLWFDNLFCKLNGGNYD